MCVRVLDHLVFMYIISMKRGVVICEYKLVYIIYIAGMHLIDSFIHHSFIYSLIERKEGSIECCVICSKSVLQWLLSVDAPGTWS